MKEKAEIEMKDILQKLYWRNGRYGRDSIDNIDRYKQGRNKRDSKDRRCISDYSV